MIDDAWYIIRYSDLVSLKATYFKCSSHKLV